jgi:xylulokinase
MDCLLGIDVGSTSMKALVYDLDGNLISQGSRPTESVANDPDHPNWQVFMPDHIWDGISSAIHDAISRMSSQHHIIAAAVTGLGADAVPVDENGKPVYPFINWVCTRTTPQFDWWLKTVGLEKTFEITGWQPFIWSTVLRFMWLKENEPEVARKVYKWLIVEDFVNFQLTGKYSTDYTDASPTLLFDQRTLQWSDEMLKLAGLSKDLLPSPQRSGQLIGGVTPEAAKKTGLAPGTPIYQGGHDYLVGALAAGAISPGMFLDVTGTWELVITPTTTPVFSPESRKLGLTVEAHSAPDMYCIWGGGTAASMLEWYKDQLGTEATHLARAGTGKVWSNLMDEAKSSPPGANGIFFLPHFNGTACPNLDPRSLGAFLGLNDTTRREDMIRALVEGLNYGSYDMLRALEIGTGLEAEKITAIGGGTRNTFWMQNKADISGRQVVTLEVEEATALGAAMLAGVGAGKYRDLSEAVGRVHRPGRTYEPNLENVSIYADLFGIYKDIYHSLSSINTRIYERFRV